MDVIAQVWKCIINYVKEYYDFFDILISFGSLATTIWLFFLGVKKMGKIYAEYLHRRDRALFNFYAQFDALLSGFEYLISNSTIDNFKGPGDILFYIWIHPNTDKQIYKVSEDCIKLLNDEVSKFLLFFYNALDQIPPKIDKLEFRAWVDNKRELIDELNNILVTTTPTSYIRGGSYDAEEVRNRYEKITRLIKYFREKINDEAERYRLKADNDRHINVEQL